MSTKYGLSPGVGSQWLWTWLELSLTHKHE